MGIIEFLVLVVLIFLTFDEIKDMKQKISELNNKVDRLTGYLMESKPLLEEDDLDKDYDPHVPVQIDENGLVTSINGKGNEEENHD